MDGAASSERLSGLAPRSGSPAFGSDRSLAAAPGWRSSGTMLFTAFDVLLRTLGRRSPAPSRSSAGFPRRRCRSHSATCKCPSRHVAMTLASDRLKGWTAALSETINSAIALVLFGTAAFVLSCSATPACCNRHRARCPRRYKVAVYPWVFVVAHRFRRPDDRASCIDLLRSLQRLLRRAQRSA